MTNNFPPVKEQLERLKDSVPPAEIVHEDELAERLDRSMREGIPLRVKQGFDASSPDLHIGHAVSLWKLRTFQKLGHTVVFLIGDFTAMVGDPSGMSKTRPRLSRQQVEENARTYRDQVFRILDPDLTEVRFNSEWHARRDIYQFLELCSNFTVRRMLERDDFWKRFKAEQPISMLEFLYPLMQAYDSVALKADVELGGTDQRFNLVLARHIQRSFNQEPQVLFLMPLLRGTDGNEKMSKSLNNAIGIADPAEEIYGKTMSIGDSMLEEYYNYTASFSKDELEPLEFPKGSFDDKQEKNPYEQKHNLAKYLVTLYCDIEEAEEEANAAASAFLSRFRDHEQPTIGELVAKKAVVKVEKDKEWLPRIMVSAGAAKSNGEAMRLIKAGAVTIDSEKFQIDGDNLDIDVDQAKIVRVGKRRFFVVYRSEEQLELDR